MERAEPAFKPEWLKTSNGGPNNANSNHHVGTSPHSDEHGISISSRNRINPSDRDKKSLNSSRRSLSSNGSRDSSHNSGKSKAYSSFGSCRRERDRIRDYESRRSTLSSSSDNGFDPFGSVQDPLRRSRSMFSGRPAVDTRTVSFEKEFPSLGENGRMDPGRVLSPGISTALQSIIPLGGVESWNSVLVDVPPGVVTNGSVNNNNNNINSSSSSSSSSSPVGQGNGGGGSIGTGLNMAETVAQAPVRARTPPQLTIDTQRIEELTLKQFKQLIPVTPSMPKSSASSASDKLKSKGGVARGGTDSLAVPKTIQQLSTTRPSDPVPKQGQIGNFQVLNREKNGLSVSLTNKDTPTPPAILTKLVGPTAVSAVPLKSPTTNQALPAGEKRLLHSQSKDKHEFFKFIRNQSHNSSVSAMSAPGPVELDKISESPEKGTGDGTGGEHDREEMERMGLEEEVEIEPDPEEEAFLLSLGWDQNAVVDALTKEEIDAFIMKYKEVKQSPKLLS